MSRFTKLRGITCNAHAPGRWIDSHGGVDREARALLHAAAGKLSLSARSYHRVLKVSRTIADLDGDPQVRESHVAEALRYRPSGARS
jgi:magnesium chelatase family protein